MIEIDKFAFGIYYLRIVYCVVGTFFLYRFCRCFATTAAAAAAAAF